MSGAVIYIHDIGPLCRAVIYIHDIGPLCRAVIYVAGTSSPHR